jgi:hypothetical protein
VAGSLTTKQLEPGSDIDMYVYVSEPLPIAVRAGIATAHAAQAEVNNQYWESGDEWIDAETGIHIDVTFRGKAWAEDEIDRVLKRHEASVGYSTCIWHNIQTSRALFDRAGWFAALQRAADQPYPAALTRAIVTKNHPILQSTLSSYIYQIDGAVRRGDWVSVNHRVAALLASYFDILFAVNALPHPGEKRLVAIALAQCETLPDRMREQVEALIRAVGLEDEQVIVNAEALLDALDDWLRREKLLPAS